MLVPEISAHGTLTYKIIYFDLKYFSIFGVLW